MKKFFVTLSAVLALLIVAIPSLQIAAAGNQNSIEYLAEVRIGVGKTEEEAEKALAGYTILKYGNNNVDLNQKAGGGKGSKGERVVYLGYKTTTDRTEAITDLAVMNMKGGYSVKDYELLMQQYMTEQIIPFVDKFLVTIKEYRENYNSSNEENKARAQYIHDALNKLTDDDCGDAGLGDLLLNETKYEMGDAAYEALSEEEKKSHADIITIISQANGKAALIMENLITRAADTSEDTWIDRFTSTSYDDLLALYPDMLPSEAEAILAKEYDDDAREILSMWSNLKEILDSFDEKMARLEELESFDLSEDQKIIEEYVEEGATEAQKQAYISAIVNINTVTNEMTSLYADVLLHEFLSNVEYNEGTLLDFFLQDYQTVKNDTTMLYPLVASLSAGQRAGLEFVTMSDLIMMSSTDSEGYKDADTDSLDKTSIYENVDRAIFQSGGVALTSDALRAHAAEEIVADSDKLSLLSYILLGAAGTSVIAFGVTVKIKYSQYSRFAEELDDIEKKIIQNGKSANEAKTSGNMAARTAYNEIKEDLKTEKETLINSYNKRSPFATKLVLGFGIVMVVLSSIALYFSYRDLVDYYNVDYTPIPKYIVDEKDITAYNTKGDKIVIRNQVAYYRAVETNRSSGDEWFDILGKSADLNGTVGQQWLALYAAKNENMAPIVADSFKVVVGSEKVPSDYIYGIHMFGSESACNLNNTDYVWNNDAPSVFVYYSIDTNAAKNQNANGGTVIPKRNNPSESNVSAGHLILAGVIGLAVGVLATIGTVVILKKKKNAQQAPEEIK